jgi:hypothetical protein
MHKPPRSRPIRLSLVLESYVNKTLVSRQGDIGHPLGMKYVI